MHSQRGCLAPSTRQGWRRATSLQAALNLKPKARVAERAVQPTRVQHRRWNLLQRGLEGGGDISRPLPLPQGVPRAQGFP